MYYQVCAIIYLIVLIICFLVSIRSFTHNFSFALKLFSVFLGITCITELLAYLTVHFFHAKNNMPVYNIFRIFEFYFTLYFFNTIIKNKWVNIFTIASSIAYPFVWLYGILSVYGLSGWNSLFADINGAYGIVLAAIYLYRLYSNDEFTGLKHHPEFWISISLLFYNACTMPIMGLYFYLLEKHPDLANNLINALQPINILLYVVFIYAYLCRKTYSTIER